MGNYNKGASTKNKILKRVNGLFNEREQLLTLDEIARELSMNKSRITNHFPKKELLILGIYQEYEKRLMQLLSTNKPDGETVDFQELVHYYSDILDLFYEYRFAITYIFINPMRDEELIQYITETSRGNKVRIFHRLKFMVQSGLLKENVLIPGNYDVFIFKYTNLMTTWTISLNIYDRDFGYEQMKPVYLKGILSCFENYLTEKGREEYDKAIDSIEARD